MDSDSALKMQILLKQGVSRSQGIVRYILDTYKDINWEKPLVPTRMLKKVGRKVSLGYAILDLLAESSLYALYMSDVLDLIRLQNMYPSMYDNMDMDEVAGLVIGAIRQR